MKDKLADWPTTLGTELKTQDAHTTREHPIIQDAIAALIALGFKASDATKVVNKMADGAKTSEEIIRRSLREMVA
jgi:Holliday junction DNA helicase RuvA